METKKKVTNRLNPHRKLMRGAIPVLRIEMSGLYRQPSMQGEWPHFEVPEQKSTVRQSRPWQGGGCAFITA